ncbi:MAG: hypothetical protein N4J56_002034 [Chroococcidiopsis sp. SAG 2025]|uniref:SNF2-related protein n=1 Tax=Chroococcidiopsis sp. SAG 2025 TaxID=171389 RepID=UPI0029371C9F|nr:SNF2-related protein [Chroococcidiopsis sp. SAG 2025]MDV2992380.1 hypothetical protein [Chroococcidiopsis sp. SAG 2025]
MAILHCNWIEKDQQSYLFVWGEVWRSLVGDVEIDSATDVPAHPLAMATHEFLEWWRGSDISIPKSLSLSEQKQWRSQKNSETSPINLPTLNQTIALPSRETQQYKKTFICPLYSAPISEENDARETTRTQFLYPWQVEGFYLKPQEAISFLTSLPLAVDRPGNSWMGGDLRFWSQVARWSLDLLSRGKFVPNLSQQNHDPSNCIIARWQSLLDSAIDSSRLAKFAKAMPAVCCSYQNTTIVGAHGCAPLQIKFPSPPQELILEFLNSTIDAQVRAIAQQNVQNKSLPTVPSPLKEWLQGLTVDAKIQAEPAQLERLEAIVKAWTAPIQYQLEGRSLFRTCFQLSPPTEGKNNWTLSYYLQAVETPEFIIDAATIWQHPVANLEYRDRTISQPQETLLRGLGLASRLYPLIAPSLEQPFPQSCSLNPLQAYEFIKSVVWRFEDSGLGVILPSSLEREGWANRLGLKISATTPKKSDRLGLQSLLNFKWELAIGGQTLSKAEFDRLVKLNSPLVEINGEWVELRPQDIKTAQAFFTARKDNLNLSLEDALRLSTGDTQTIEKLPVVSFEASGALQELMTALTDNQAIAPLATPEGFRGELRPYQARGAGWLSFLERWGLGACLADDMGLGKCVAKDTLIYINGTLQPAEKIWDNYATESQFDGEGFWASPTQQLLVNSIDEKTGKIVQAPIRKLYRQLVHEKLRKVTLQDGSSITITHRHKLLTDRGWTNQLQVKDYVCVPATVEWKGKPEDPDLIKFVAWQIAEGHELCDRATVNISQKDTTLLKELLQIFQNLSNRYHLKINQPSICCFPDRVPTLRIDSQAYRRFLEAKGYIWGKLSAEKTIPSFIMQADLDSIRIFLRNYFDAESSVISNMRSIEVSTASPILIQQISTLLRQFGIWLQISPKQKCATNGSRISRTYYIGTIGGNSIRRFLQEIGFGISKKQQMLTAICQRVSNTNIEGIPTTDIVAQAVKVTGIPLRHFGMHNTVYINGTQQFSKDSLEQVVAGMNSLISGESQQQYQMLKSSRWTVQTLAAYARLDIEQLSLAKQSLEHLLTQEVFYSKIKNIEEIGYEGWVYDFEVSEYHNFVANNIICHNTIQFIAFLLNLKQQKALEKPTLLVCPTSVLGNWEREVRKFAPQLKVLMYHGDKRPKGKTFEQTVAGKDLVITSYALIQRDLKTHQSVSWQGIVLDEAQNIKNSEAKQSQAVRQLEAQFRFALTGTPVENRLQELWSILDFINPGYLGQRQFFQRRFAIPIEKYGDAASLKTLRSLVQPFILRRLKSDRSIIQDLPEKQEMTEFCGLSPEQAKLYEQLVETSLAEIDAADGIQRRGMILALLVKLKQLCNHPGQFLKETTLKEPQRSGKLIRLQEMLEEAISEGDRALIFTQFAEWGKLLKPHLEQKLGREIFFLYGSTSKKQREEMIDRFQHDPQGPPVMILSLKAGGTGLNLTRANHVFHFDRWWNPAVENQATDRVFRIGQTRNVQVHKFVCTGTLEEKINDMIESKKALAEQVVGAGENWLTELDTDSLRQLLVLERNAVIEEDEE